MSENKDKDNKSTDEGGIFDEPKQRYTAKAKHRDDFKRQLKILIITVIIAAVGLVAYLFVIKPIIEYSEEVPEETVELLDGEVLGPQNRILIMDYLKKDDIASIDIHNEYGDWGIEYSEEDDAFYIKGNHSAAYDKEKLQKLISAAGYTLAMERITDNAENFGEYGLSELDDPAWYVICDRDGNSHKLYIGDILPSNSGYYVRYDGRNAVYVLDYTISETLLSPIENIISPTLAFPTGSSMYYMINNFALKKDGEVFIALEYIEDENERADGSTALHRFIYPSEYVPNDTNYLNVFSLFQSYQGISTLVYQPTIDDLQKYGLDAPKYDLYFEFKNVPNNIIYSEKNENGNYYAYSPIFDIIAEVAAENADWLEWGLIDWIERPIFQMIINSVDTISLECDSASYRFKLTSGDGGFKAVTEEISGTDIENIDNFKKFYQTILMTNLQDYAELTDEEITSLKDAGAYMTLTITMKGGSVNEYKFYPYETRRSYYTVNGTGDFYILRDRMTKIIDDAAKVMTGETIVPDANN